MTLKYTDEFVNIPWDDIVRLETNRPEENPFSIAWILGRFCNYSCTYCYDFAHTNKVDHFSLEVYKNTIDEIKRQSRDNGFNRFFCNFSGGEPTAFKDFLSLSEYYCNDNKAIYNQIAMTTNLSPAIKWWQRWVDITQASAGKRLVVGSFHREFADVNEFTDKCLMLRENGVRVIINQVMEAHLFYEALERCEKWHSLGLNVTVKPQKCKTGDELLIGSYTDEMKEILKRGFPLGELGPDQPLNGIRLYDKEGTIHYIDHAERLNSLDKNVFTGWTCEAGYRSVTIRGNNVIRAHSCADKYLGTVTDGFELFKEAKPCISKICITSTDSKLTKWRAGAKPVGAVEHRIIKPTVEL